MNRKFLTISVREDTPGRFRVVVLDGAIVLGSRCWFGSAESAEIAGVALVDQIVAERRDKEGRKD